MSKHTILSTPVIRKEYRYELNGTQLSFTLRQENSSELVAFLSLLKVAQTDLEKDFKTHK